MSSPTEDLLHKKTIMESTTEVTSNQQNSNKLAHLPPNLKLLYDSLSVRLDSIDYKIDLNISTRVENVEAQQRESECRLMKIEKENC